MVCLPEYVVFDLETNADVPDPSEHEIIQIGAVLASSDGVLRDFETLVRPQRRLPRRITEVTGLEYGDLEHAPALENVLQLVLEAGKKARGRSDSERFDAVLVDEAQDFDHPRLTLAYSMLKSDRLSPDPAQPDRDNFVMAYDVAQNVYRRGGARWNPPGVDAQGRSRTARGRSTVFRKNYRNTREILEFAMNFLAGSREWSSASVDLDDPAALIPLRRPRGRGRGRASRTAAT